MPKKSNAVALRVVLSFVCLAGACAVIYSLSFFYAHPGLLIVSNLPAPEPSGVVGRTVFALSVLGKFLFHPREYLPLILNAPSLGAVAAAVLLLVHALLFLFRPAEIFRFYVTASAVAKHTFRDAIRKKVLLVLVLFALVIVALSQFFPVVTAQDRMKLMLSVFLKATAFFGTLVAIFLAATNIPQDIADKTIFTVLTKPIGRGAYLFGRFLGFVLTMALLLFVMGGASYVFISYTASRTGGAETSSAVGPAGQLLVAEKMYRAKRFERVPGPEKEEQGMDVLWLRMMDDRGVYRFEGLRRKDFPEKSLRFASNFLFSSRTGAISEGSFRVVFTNPKGVRKEYTVSDAETDQMNYLEVDGILLEEDGVLTAEVFRADTDTYVGMGEGSFLMLGKARPFATNFAISFLITFFGTVAILGVAICSSTFLSGAVSVLLSFFIYFCGNLLEVIRMVAQSLRQPGSRALFDPKFLGEAQAEQAREAVNKLARMLLDGLAKVLPDFKVFGTERYLLQNTLIPFGHFFLGACYALVIVLVCMAIGWVVFRFREVAK